MTTQPLINRAATFSDVESDGRHLFGRAFYFDRPSLVTDDSWRTSYQEEFARTCANKTIADGKKVSLMYMHPFAPGSKSDPEPFGSVVFRAGEDGLEFEAYVSKTRKGDDMLALISDGAVSGASITARTIRNSRKGNIVRREEIAIRELSLTPPGVQLHEGAGVLAIRSEHVSDDTAQRNLIESRIRLGILRNSRY